VWTADVWAFIPAQTEPVHVLVHCCDELGSHTFAIEIVIPQYQGAPGSPSALLRDPESPRVPSMEIAGWGRGQSTAIGRKIQAPSSKIQLSSKSNGANSNTTFAESVSSNLSSAS
jgi:hypothetical protein